MIKLYAKKPKIEESTIDTEITSREIERLQKKIEETSQAIAEVREMQKTEDAELQKLDAEFGGEITRIKKEFARMRERSIEEAVEISNKAKTDALKEILPITDNYFRAKKLFEPLQTDSEKSISEEYDSIFISFQKVIEVFAFRNRLLLSPLIKPSLRRTLGCRELSPWASHSIRPSMRQS